MFRKRQDSGLAITISLLIPQLGIRVGRTKVKGSAACAFVADLSQRALAVGSDTNPLPIIRSREFLKYRCTYAIAEIGTGEFSRRETDYTRGIVVDKTTST